MRNMKQTMLRDEKQIGRISWFFYLQNGHLRDNKWRVFRCYKQSSFTLKRVKLTEFHSKDEGNKFKWKRRKFRLR